MVDVEERRLEVRSDAVRGEQALDHADEGVLAARQPLVAGHVLEVAERRHELRQRDRLHRPPLEPDRLRVASAGRLDLGERVQGVDVARVRSERCAVLARRRCQPAVRPVELAELHVRPGEGLGLVDGRVHREAHRRDGSGEVAAQLARVRDPRVGGEAGPEARQPVEGRERLAVAAELDERIADDAVAPRGRGRERNRPTAERERLAEAMPRERERAEAARREEVVRGERERTSQHALRFGVVGRIAGLARPLLVREAEEVVRVHVPRVAAERRLERTDERRRVGRAELVLERARCGFRRRRRHRAPGVAEEADQLIGKLQSHGLAA